MGSPNVQGAAGLGRTSSRGLNVQLGRRVLCREVTRTIRRSSQLTDDQPVELGWGYTNWHSGSAEPDKRIGGQKT
ncbi:hypothetical protein Q5P01_018162 [Channa striata]|uniref:Uncharacterized protein n=1 Tax=Channa striata TaxID=64152 RepID=A0AA88M4Q8_CHASR|nr:hypothetical protein Q5P01_018162 [Channa striata]